MGLTIANEPIPLQQNQQGVVRVGGTRVTLDTVIAAFEEGATAEEIVDQYPSISLADAYAVIAYYLHHRAEVDAYLAQRRSESGAVREQNVTRFGSTGVRERLLTRRPIRDSG
jgi:uncharacterized protein (DUF433 family)